MNDDSAGDFFAIQNLYSRYCFGIDQTDPDLFRDCFTEDGIFQVAERQFKGTEELRAMALNAGTARPRHSYTNLWVKNLAGAKAQSAAYFTLLKVEDGTCCAYGHYEDDLERDTQRVWRFQHRRVIFLWKSEAYQARLAGITKK